MRDDFSESVVLAFVLILGGLIIATLSVFLQGAISVLPSISTALITAGLVSALYNYWFSRQSRELRHYFTDSVEVLRSTSTGGVYRIYESIGKVLSEYASIIAHARFRIHIVGADLVPFFWLLYIFETCEKSSRGESIRKD